MSSAKGFPSILVLLDLSAAFDTIDHELLLNDLRSFGIQDKALALLKSYMSLRTQYVSAFNSSSEIKLLKFGVPQGSILGPILFSCYTSSLADVMLAHGFSFHLYADDTQIYIPIKDISRTHERIVLLLSDIKIWMRERKLKLNDSKTEFIFVNGPLRSADSLGTRFLHDMNDITFSSKVKNLGVILDNKLSFGPHIDSIVKQCNYQLRKLSSIQKYIDRDAMLILVHSFITTRIDFCNSLLINLPSKQLRKLQQILNKCVRLIFNLSPTTPTSAYLIKLHWLPLKARIEYKICLLVFKILHSGQPKYLYDLLVPYSNDSHMTLRLYNDPYYLSVPSGVQERIFGERSFSYIAPRLYNSLPIDIKASNSVHHFKKNLKFYYFNLSYDVSSMSTKVNFKL